MKKLAKIGFITFLTIITLSCKKETTSTPSPLIPTWTNYKTNIGLGNIISIAIDSAGDKWFANGPGILKFDNINWTYYIDTVYNVGYPVNVIFIDPNGNKWVAW